MNEDEGNNICDFDGLDEIESGVIKVQINVVNNEKEEME